MRRTPLYSSSSARRVADQGNDADPADTPVPAAAEPIGAESSAPSPQKKRGRGRALLTRYRSPLWAAGGVLLTLAAVALYAGLQPLPRKITQDDIDAAVLHTLNNKTLPSPAAKAYQIIGPSVVRVRGLMDDADGLNEIETGVGSGVVILDKGVILTNLHVAAAAKRLKIVFASGLESEAAVIALQPENDLAVLQAKSIPDDLVPATLRSTRDLAVGDRVVAVGFPFGIGPSASAGVVSGLRREFRSPEGNRVLTNLIQFDAAANPGSSGGPLVTADGEVVGIVTAILNPTEQRVFVGIGFAVPIENAASAVGMSPF
jgi:S1-C subfamily serine protease